MDGKETVFIGEWEVPNWNGEKREAAVCHDFQIEPEVLGGIRLLLAYYLYEDYTGNAFCLFQRDGLLYEVNGGHCSCYGLEGQWKPEETTVKALRYRLDNGKEGVDYFSGIKVFAAELRTVLDSLETAALREE